jgi:polyisoprenyl-phosphate glycosyltransferase
MVHNVVISKETCLTDSGKGLPANSGHYVFIMPVYNDWESVSILLRNLDAILGKEKISAEVLIVDDGSSQPNEPHISKDATYDAIEKLDILRLNRNLGHQRALAIALSHMSERRDLTAVIVMDGDGEDNPEDVPRLIAEAQATTGEKIIFAARGKRSEGLIFRLFYSLYKKMYQVMTGVEMNFGNFSLIPRKLLDRLVIVAELWNNYPASVLKARLPFGKITTVRARRYKGISQMNYISLIMHGLSAISVFGEVIGIRALIAMIGVSILSILSIVIVVTIRLFLPQLAVPGWASYLVASFMVILLQSLTMTLFFIFMILHSRNYTNFLPKRDYQFYIFCSESIIKR